MRYTDLELNSAAMDQTKFEGVPRRLLIVAPPRTGSSLLCQLMLNAGIGVPHEYFNEFHIRCLCSRFGLPVFDNASAMPAEVMQRYLVRLFSVRSPQGLFATKLQHKQFRLFVKNKIETALFGGARLVYLTRKDVLAQAVSWHFAELTERWGFEPRILTKPKKEQNFFDVEAIMSYVDEILAEQVLWEYLFHTHRLLPLRITYEDLQADAVRVLRDVAEYADIALAHFQSSYEELTPYEGAPDAPNKREVIDYVRRIWADGLSSCADQAAGVGRLGAEAHALAPTP